MVPMCQNDTYGAATVRSNTLIRQGLAILRIVEKGLCLYVAKNRIVSCTQAPIFLRTTSTPQKCSCIQAGHCELLLDFFLHPLPPTSSIGLKSPPSPRFFRPALLVSRLNFLLSLLFVVPFTCVSGQP